MRSIGGDIAEYEKQLGFCAPTKAWIRPQLCAYNKQSKSMFSCDKCSGLVEGSVGNKHRACSDCGEVKKIHGYGMCSKCLYRKYGKSMKPPAPADDVLPRVQLRQPVEDSESGALESPEQAESVTVCKGCGKSYNDPDAWPDECPFCMADPRTGVLPDIRKAVVNNPTPAPLIDVFLPPVPLLQLDPDVAHGFKSRGADSQVINEILRAVLSGSVVRAA